MNWINQSLNYWNCFDSHVIHVFLSDFVHVLAPQEMDKNFKSPEPMTSAMTDRK